MIGRWLLWLPVGICAVLAPCSAMAANGIPENAANGDPCGGIRPCDLGGNFTIDEMPKQKPARYGVFVSRAAFGKRW
jgi:hypothetical protein